MTQTGMIFPRLDNDSGPKTRAFLEPEAPWSVSSGY